LRARASAKTIDVNWGVLKPAGYGVAVIAAVVTANMMLLTGPADQRLTEQASAYAAQADSSVALTANGSEAGLPVGERPNLWADTLLGIGKALSPSMKLDRLQLAGSEGKAAAGQSNLAITGVLPQGGADLKLVAGFIDHLSQDQSFKKRFAQVRFTGVGEGSGAGAQNAAGASPELRRENLFHVLALSGGRK
jgi:hypothetical protein